LLSSKFPEYLTDSLILQIRLSTDSDHHAVHNKLLNKAIKYRAADLSGEVVVALETETMVYNQAKLIDVCYKNSYPQLHAILRKALILSETHPIFELAFYHAGILEDLLKAPKFNTIFNNQSILLLMQKGLINPSSLFDNLTITPREKEIAKVQCNQLATNLPFFDFLVRNNIPATEDELSRLLYSPKTNAFFRDQSLHDVLAQRFITLSMIESIVPHKIDNKVEFAKMAASDKFRYLRAKFSLGVPVEPEVTDEDDLFNVPDVAPPVVVEQTTKPAINVGLLIQSMSQSVFTSTPKSSSSTHVLPLSSDTSDALAIAS
jgi:hypothetical protein